MGQRIGRALISVSDKAGVIEFAESLRALGVEILSTGGTYQLLEKSGIDAVQVSNHTGFPEIMSGRVKTLHPRIHGGILGRRGLDDQVMEKHNIDPIDLVVVNLYPFEKAIADDSSTLAVAVENIDIGGPAMIRSAAKNHEHVWVVCDPDDYQSVAQALSSGDDLASLRMELAAKAFAHTARYDSIIARYFSNESFPDSLTLTFEKSQVMRYGENPHQSAVFYRDTSRISGAVSDMDQLQGKELSYNNIADTNAALECVNSFEDVACVIVKHANPCGVAVSKTLKNAYEQAFLTDPTSAFGGILAFNRCVDAETLETILEKQFAEVIVAPGFDERALEIAKSKKNLRILRTGNSGSSEEFMDFKKVAGGLLVQTPDNICWDPAGLKLVTARQPNEQELSDMEFAWKVAWYVKSNAIVYGRDGRTIGIGAGQMSRVISAKIALLKAKEEGLRVEKSVMASDAFFPFRDSIDAAAEAGISAIIQPGGSVRDNEVIEAADENGIAMVFTGIRHFRH